MNKRRLIWLVLLAVGLLLPTTPVLAGDASPPGDDGIVVWNEDYALEADEQLDGNLVVFNGDVTLETGSRVEGTVIIWNGNVEVEGTVEGDIVVSDGDICLGDNAHVNGNVVCSWECDLKQQDGAYVEGVFTEGEPLGDLHIEPLPGIPVNMPYPSTFWVSGSSHILGWVVAFIRGVAAVLVVSTVAGLVALIWPQPTAVIGRTLVKAPWHSFGIGILTVIAAAVTILVLIMLVCTTPIAALAALALGAAGLFGWIAIGALVGERLLQALKVRETAPLWTAGLGTLAITLVSTGVSNGSGLASLGWMGSSVGCCLTLLGWIGTVILGCLGLGAVVLTRFGTTAYTPSPNLERLSEPTPPPPPPTPVPVEEIESLDTPVETDEKNGA